MLAQRQRVQLAPGLFGLALATLAASRKTSLTQGFAYLIHWAVFIGTLAQCILGIINYQQGNNLGGAVFYALSLFWYAVAASWMITLNPIPQDNPNPRQTGFVGFCGQVALVFTAGEKPRKRPLMPSR